MVTAAFLNTSLHLVCLGNASYVSEAYAASGRLKRTLLLLSIGNATVGQALMLAFFLPALRKMKADSQEFVRVTRSILWMAVIDSWCMALSVTMIVWPQPMRAPDADCVQALATYHFFWLLAYSCHGSDAAGRMSLFLITLHRLQGIRNPASHLKTSFGRRFRLIGLLSGGFGGVSWLGLAAIDDRRITQLYFGLLGAGLLATTGIFIRLLRRTTLQAAGKSRDWARRRQKDRVIACVLLSQVLSGVAMRVTLALAMVTSDLSVGGGAVVAAWTARAATAWAAPVVLSPVFRAGFVAHGAFGKLPKATGVRLLAFVVLAHIAGGVTSFLCFLAAA